MSDDPQTDLIYAILAMDSYVTVTVYLTPHTPLSQLPYGPPFGTPGTTSLLHSTS